MKVYMTISTKPMVGPPDATSEDKVMSGVALEGTEAQLDILAERLVAAWVEHNG